jgi:hypothetical protein
MSDSLDNHNEIKVVLSAVEVEAASLQKDARELLYKSPANKKDRITLLIRCLEDVMRKDEFAGILGMSTKDLLLASLKARVNELDDLLWSKSLDYEGPLYDGYQHNEYRALSVLITSWVMESYGLVFKVKGNEVEKVKAVFRSEKLLVFARLFLGSMFKQSLIDVGSAKAEALVKELEETLTAEVYDRVSALTGLYDDAIGSFCGCLTGSLKDVAILINSFSKRMGAVSTALNESTGRLKE